MPTVITAADGADFLALVPHLLGYQPERSVVLVAFRGRRTCGALRFDLPDAASTAQLRRTATTMVGMLCRIPSVDAMVAVVYTDATFADGMPHADLLDVLVHRAEVSGLRVRDAFCVGVDAWASLLDPESPKGGHPLGEIAASAVSAVARAEGLSTDRQPKGEVSLPSVSLADAERVARILDSVDRHCVAGTVLEVAAAPLMDLVARVEELLGRPVGDLRAGDLALLGAVAERPLQRDVVILQVAFGRAAGHRAAAMQLAALDGESIDDDAGAHLLSGTGPRPDPDRLERGIEVMSLVTAAMPRSRRAGAFSMLAWFHWALGSSSRAAVHIDRALECDPGHGLSELIDRMVRGGRLPDWAFDVPLVDESEVRYAALPHSA
ncbi:DUF4192 family protein [Glaciibacter flavus]|uniref:DUF4192 family protein n=1 Tax=Orlajensenia flava TaxID=2565934 RepID=A0A4S4FX67_9MICO|nr:DUF4192 family protein [Glaciibacter flavus]THG35600.1 DUF4192 family protein [Glaciibacter flavus]